MNLRQPSVQRHDRYIYTVQKRSSLFWMKTLSIVKEIFTVLTGNDFPTGLVTVVLLSSRSLFPPVSSRTNLKVLALVLVLGPQVLVRVSLDHKVLEICRRPHSENSLLCVIT